MREEAEFLRGMWQKTEVLEEQLERESVLRRDREIKKKRVILSIIFAFVFIAVCTASLFVTVDAAIVVILSVAMILLSIMLEFRAMKSSMKVG